VRTREDLLADMFGCVCCCPLKKSIDLVGQGAFAVEG
jgi:hypothetical protein